MVRDYVAADDDFSVLDEPSGLGELLEESLVVLLVDDSLVVDDDFELPPLVPPRLEGLE